MMNINPLICKNSYKSIFILAASIITISGNGCKNASSQDVAVKRADSTAKAAHRELNQQIRKDSLKNVYQSDEAKMQQLTIMQTDIQNKLNTDMGVLARDQDELNQAQKFQLGRSHAEREQQIQDITTRIQNDNAAIDNLKQALNTCQNDITSLTNKYRKGQ